ncbi:MAG: hypothetical protein FWH41_01690 [Treponema sp.]|nr:hypothetical protein [Treponema sp.]
MNYAKGAISTIENNSMLMIRLIGSFIVVIIGGVLGIVGSDKKPSKIKPIILGILTFASCCFLFPLNNYIAVGIYLVAGFLLLLAGLTTKAKIPESKKLKGEAFSKLTRF